MDGTGFLPRLLAGSSPAQRAKGSVGGDVSKEPPKILPPPMDGSSATNAAMGVRYSPGVPRFAHVVELADTLVLETSAARHTGSTPVVCTKDAGVVQW